MAVTLKAQKFRKYRWVCKKCGAGGELELNVRATSTGVDLAIQSVHTAKTRQLRVSCAYDPDEVILCRK